MYAIYALVFLFALSAFGATSLRFARYLDNTGCDIYNMHAKASAANAYYRFGVTFLTIGVIYLACRFNSRRARGAILAVGIPITLLTNVAIAIALILAVLGAAVMIAIGIGLFMLLGWIIEQIENK